MDANELNRMDYLAAVRLSEIGFRRYEKERARALQNLKISEARKTLAEWIDRWEARERTLSMMVRVAPMREVLRMQG